MKLELREDSCLNGRAKWPGASDYKRYSPDTTSALFTRKGQFQGAFCRRDNPHEDCSKVKDRRDRKL